ncbi:DUF4179 domain-containing protein [Gorillibacterium timonense]|uniref:DUF4179 domain-containing protein n=1 Tax=Gorillibacterium timonense TaxID=1689269 RepID=UPI00071CA4CA|nr:DUF4179 domain-containing protein [Gorillibacterium timonense]
MREENLRPDGAKRPKGGEEQTTVNEEKERFMVQPEQDGDSQGSEDDSWRRTDAKASGKPEGESSSSREEHPPSKLTLAELKSHYENTSLPSGLAGVVQSGMARAAKRRQTKIRSRLAAWTAAAVLLLFIGSVRVSPVFASYVSRIPGMEGFVEFFSQDKGLQLAVDHDLMQEIDASDSREGVTFRVNGVIADEARIVIFYTLTADKNTDLPPSFGYDVRLYDDQGQAIKEGYTVAGGFYPPPDKTASNSLEIELMEDLRLEPAKIDIALHPESEPGVKSGSEWKVSFSIDQSKFQGMRQEQRIDKSFTVAGQTFRLENAIYYPTRMKLKVVFDPANPLHIYGLEGLTLKDENGRAWTTKTATFDPDGMTYFFESTYFTRPHRLTLEGLGVVALKNEDLPIRVDLKTGKLLNGPSGLEYLGSEVSGKDRRVSFRVKRNSDYTAGFSIEKATDEAGTLFEAHTMETRQQTFDEGEIDYSYIFVFTNGAQMKDTLAIYPSYFPAVLQDPYKVEFKTPF